MRKLIAAFFCLAPVASLAWWNNDWNFRKEITLDLTATGANVTGSVSDVPVLMRLSLGNFGYFGDTKPDGSDLRFVAGDDKTPLKYHIERYDATNQMAFLWVRVPQMAGATNTTKIFLYYGNTKAPGAPTAADTYDVSQVLTLHFGEGDAALADATAYGNRVASSTAELNPASLIGGGVKFDGHQAMTVPSSANLRLLPAKGMTLSAWVRIDQPQGDARVLALEDQGKHFLVGLRGALPYARLTSGNGDAEAAAKDAIATGGWHHVAATSGGGKLTLYVDGVEAGTANAQPAEIAGTLTIGNNAAGNAGLVGEVDEVQAASLARPADWLRAAATSQGLEAPLVAYGADAQREGEKVSYFKVTLQNVTIDGWVVIIILAVMFVIAMLIMIGKTVFLARVEKGNAAFLREFARLRGDPTALDRPDTNGGDDALDESAFMPHLGETKSEFKYSTIFRLYHHGVHELSGRVGAKAAGANGTNQLSSQSIEALRATLDANLVRMTQKLQARMVLLTIAIAGGPFLGLLGTVVGVMITFAAIAASGDVNVNSIAPGIAAALAATVAGLAVAIPALFGYNWLNTKIKNITADMRVFVDEFVTRVAEHYS